ncbi:TetR/AcrR family transcriptional regulator [Actinopolyspora mortivallis]|uniref:TetR/AcrR family transcriptional regulator n=1 Tax=Actinopolyspora mortivallis TaxID=33906 RepID=UPI00036B3256|nr:TetR/AcrR family transcriptional regulator [Actinopolyspora mortivallis]
MDGVARRESSRSTTEPDIRRRARNLLVREGQEAVTLRAIAREMGITAPALYRYYSSREELLFRLSEDVCVDLSAELTASMRDGATQLDKVFAVCRGFRRWALEHPREFALVFATPTGAKAGEKTAPTERDAPGRPERHDELGRVFLRVAGPLMAEGVAESPPASLPDELRVGLADSQRDLAESFAAEGIEIPREALSAEAVYLLLRWWARLYGQVALEVFGQFPFDVSEAGRLFESMLVELATESGLR